MEKRSNELFAQFQEEILRKQNEVIKNLESTEKTLLAKVDRNPRLWDKSSLEGLSYFCLRFGFLSIKPRNVILKFPVILKIRIRVSFKQSSRPCFSC